MTGDELSELSFEAALARLEAIVRKLESGEASLEASIDLYTEGQQLKAHCDTKLDAATAKIEAIQMNAGGDATATRPFEAS
jgi:exodeoxyribonuclease VII small subunit